MSTSHDSVMREASKKHSAAYSFSKIYPAFIVLALALVTSVIVWRVTAEKVESDKATAFEKATASVVSRLNTAVSNHMQIIRSMHGLYESFPFVVRDVFELYGSIPVKTYPSLQAVAFTPPVPRKELGSFVYFAQSERYYTYSLHPKDSMDMYYPVFYTVPLEKNQKLVGFNMAANPVAKETIERATAQNQIVASPMLVLPGNDNESFLLMVAVEKHDTTALGVRGHEVNGLLFVQILAREFFDSAIGKGVASDTSIVFSIYDQTSSGEDLIYSAANRASIDTNYTVAFEQKVSVPVADREFIVQFATVPGFGGGFQNNLPWLTLAAGIISSFLLFAFTLSILTSRARAQDLAERMTRSQRRIVDSSSDLIGIVGLDGEVRAMNPASLIILGYEPEEMIGKNLNGFILPEDQAKVRAIMQSARDEQRVEYEVRMIAKTGAYRWISWNDTISLTDRLVYSIGRDITDRRIAEEEIKLKNRQIDISRQYAAESTRFKSEFMSQVSFYFRTSLTGIIGYLQLVMSRMYKTPEEGDNYIETAFMSAENLLSRVSDLLDVAEGDDSILSKEAIADAIPLRTVFDGVAQILTNNGHRQSVTFAAENASNYHVNVNRVILEHVLSDVSASLLDGLEKAQVQFSLEVNTHENVVDIHILTPVNEAVTPLIELLRRTSSLEELLEVLRNDRNDILFRLAGAMSHVRMMNGHLVVETLGEEGNVAILTLPVKKIPSLERLKKVS